MSPKILLAKYIRDLLVLPEAQISIGRTNKRQENTQQLLIVVDALASTDLISASQVFDGANEVMTIYSSYATPMTVNFYGDDAKETLDRFLGLSMAQVGVNLRTVMAIDVLLANRITDLRNLDGEQYSERYELELTLQHYTAIETPTLRIDTAEFSFIV